MITNKKSKDNLLFKQKNNNKQIIAIHKQIKAFTFLYAWSEKQSHALMKEIIIVKTKKNNFFPLI